MADNENTEAHPSEALEFATIHSSVPGSENRPHPSEALEFATVAPAVSRIGSAPHPSEELEFATVSPALSRVGSAPHPSESLDFITVSPTLSRLETQSHPSEALEFATVSPSLAGHRSFSSGTVTTRNSKPGAVRFEYAERSASDAERSGSDPDSGAGDRDGKGGHKEMITQMSKSVPGLRNLVKDASNASSAEKKMTLRQGLRMYPKAIGWSMMLSMTLVMEGYDLSIINGFYALPSFRRRYGNQVASGDYEISTAWQSALVNGAVVGEVLGLFFNGVITEKIGYRKCLITALLFLCAAIFLAFFAFHITMLMVSEVLCGLSWGVFQTLSTTYAAEVMPVALRAYLTSNVNLCWLIGQTIGLSVLRGTVDWTSSWAYRIPFGLQWMWALPILVGTFLAPESPWWFIRKERYEDAKNSLHRLTSRGQNFNADETIAMMRHTNEVEKYITAGTSYLDCLKGPDLRRTEIVCMVWMIQVLSGGPMAGYSSYFLTRAGFDAEKAFDLSAGMYGLAIIAHLCALVLMRYVGRRKLYMFGCGAMCATLLAAGSVGTRPQTSKTSGALGGLLILVTFFYDLTVGPVCYTLVSEIPSTRLRIKTVVLGRVAYNVVSVIANILMPQMLNPSAWNLRGKTAYIWAVTAFFSLVWCYFRLPEPKGLTFMELDILFQKKASARKFRKFTVHLANTGYFELVDRDDENKHWEGVAG